ncbi:unnamed protein product [Somion occarium]|uniref:RRM domain-containing protein n=1 Tax=Somion occarium TaxID=3059160 RepID=A0ABP1CHF8_9APHY
MNTPIVTTPATYGPSTPTKESRRVKERDPSITTDALEPLDISPSNDRKQKHISPAMQRFATRPLRRSSSRIERWVQHQQVLQTVPGSPPGTPDSSEPPAPSSNCHPYLAYPHLNPPSLSRRHNTSVETAILITEQDDERDAQVLRFAENTPSTPRKANNAGNVFATPPSRRKFDLTFTHTRKASGADSVASSSLASIFHHRTTSNNDTLTPSKRQSHLSASLLTQRPSRVTASELDSFATPQSTCKTKTKTRPTVLGHFMHPVVEGQTTPDDGSPPRPSTSSTSTFTRSSASVSTTATSYAQSSSDALGTSPSKFTFGSLRSHSPASLFRGSPSLWSLPADATHMNDPPNSTKVIAKDSGYEKGAMRVAQSLRVQSGSSLGLGPVSQLLGSPRRRKKRKLIISGVPVGDKRRTDALLRWCQTFGEVNQITRAPNGDLHIDFKSAEVADTVCRLHARVYIGGVGSVGLSWFTGKRP